MRLKRKQYKRDLFDIESLLQSSLKPVSPRPEFIQSLQRGLMEYTYPQSESSETDLKRMILFAFVGFTGLLFVFSLWTRLVVLMISMLGMVQSSKQNKRLNY
jgi:hypothetical protein